jgi:acetylornithine deacetylase/succinyl-diaminopimelate desuccinylase-like protein
LLSNNFLLIPFHVNQDYLEPIHALDERIKVSDFNDGIGFYVRLILNTTGDEKEIIRQQIPTE